LRHAGHNLAIALINTVVLGLVFGAVTVGLAMWTSQNQWGLLHQMNLPWLAGLMLAIVLLDLWMYAWHRLNHAIPLLWRFHRMHHSDHATQRRIRVPRSCASKSLRRTGGAEARLLSVHGNTIPIRKTDLL
jgi:hypothetical protein